MSRQWAGLGIQMTRGLLVLRLVSVVVGGEVQDLQKRAATDVRMIAESVRSYAAAQNKYPGELNRFTDAGTIEDQLVPDHLAALPPLDPWGRPYWYWTNGEHFIVGCGGPHDADQRWSATLATHPGGPATALQALCISPGQAAVLLVDGNFCGLSKDITEAPTAGTLTEQERQVLTARDVRMIAIAVMEYSIDNNTYPVLFADGPTGVQILQPVMEPNYVRGLPLTDGWDRSYLYWSDGKNFLVYSTGGDDEDQPYYALLRDTDDAETRLAQVCSGASRRVGADIVFANGEPCRWPEGSLEH